MVTNIINVAQQVMEAERLKEAEGGEPLDVEVLNNIINVSI